MTEETSEQDELAEVPAPEVPQPEALEGQAAEPPAEAA